MSGEDVSGDLKTVSQALGFEKVWRKRMGLDERISEQYWEG